jgi:hypothetical protein
MIMQHHWGLAVGHTYTHPESSDHTVDTQNCRDEMECSRATNIYDSDESDVIDDSNGLGDPDPDPEDTEFSLENREHVNLDVSDQSSAYSGCDEDLYMSDVEG